MPWNWGKLSIRSSAARRTIEEGLGQDKQEPVFSTDDAAQHDAGRAEPTLSANSEPELLHLVAPTQAAVEMPAAAVANAKAALPAWDAKPVAFKPAPPLGLRVKAQVAEA